MSTKNTSILLTCIHRNNHIFSSIQLLGTIADLFFFSFYLLSVSLSVSHFICGQRCKVVHIAQAQDWCGSAYLCQDNKNSTITKYPLGLKHSPEKQTVILLQATTVNIQIAANHYTKRSSSSICSRTKSIKTYQMLLLSTSHFAFR